MKKSLVVLLALAAVASQAFGFDVASLLSAHPDVAIGLSGLAFCGVVKTQGTDLYFIDPEGDSIKSAGCVTSIDGIDTTIEQIDTTCLSDTARTFVAGLATPGTATFTINTDLKDSNHVRLLELKQSGTVLKWAIGWSEAPGTPPTAVDSNGDFNLPTTRSWLLFEGFMNSFPFSFTGNSVVNSTVGIQVSGEVVGIGAVTP